MRRVAAELRARGVSDIRLDEPLALHTTWKIGGPADLLVVPHDKRELAETVAVLRDAGVPWLVLGRGSNVLVTDKGVRGVVVKLGDGLARVRFDGVRATAGGAVSLIKLAVVAAKRGLSGLEFASGIPGTVGGAVFMNAGAHGSDMSKVVEKAEVLTPAGVWAEWSGAELEFGYRHSRLHREPAIVTEVVFRLGPDDRREIEARMTAYRERRLRTQPFTSACAGSTFRNPPDAHAAELIEKAGLKGFRVGGAQISPLHANFIVNTGDATAHDVLTLMDLIRSRVYDAFGIELVPEIVVVGER